MTAGSQHRPVGAAATLAVQAVTAMGGGLLWEIAVDRLSQRMIVPAVLVLAGC
ncbi:hypothetical protein [Frankia sp. QA3]|uniref:hypothetical protein n=1 Tax=Frankia sp. QA3 TaxID=710111 RepID=UPI0002DA60BA|nr:hypothetical protein [Frankia sp. QA3]